MLKMKKILGILLAVCFVLSVTAATAAAHLTDRKKKYQEKGKKFDGKKFGHHGKSFNKYTSPCGYWKKVVIVKKIYFGHHKKVIKITKWVWVSTHSHHGHGSWCKFKFPGHHS